MRTRSNWLAGAGLLLAAFLGGAASQWLLHGPQAFAQDELPGPAPAALEAQAFRLVNADGAVLASLATDAQGQPFLDLKGTAGGIAVTTTHAVAYDKGGKPRAFFGMGAQNAPAMTMVDDNGKTRVVVSLRADGSPQMVVNDGHEKPLWMAPAPK